MSTGDAAMEGVAAATVADLDGLVALITGGGSGIGAATAAHFVSRGATVHVLDPVAPAEDQPGVTAHQGDVTQDQDIAATLGAIEAADGGLDILVNNAAVSAVGDCAANARDEWSRVLEVNVVSVARMTALALPLLRQSAHAAVVNVTSFGALVGIRNRAVYCASKGAIDGLTLSMAADHLDDGIRVNAVAPGTADTPWVERLVAQSTDPEAEARKLRGRQPIGRLITPAEIAWAIGYLASPLSGSTTATILPVDGGITGLRL